MNVLDLFSGIGGFSLGLERAGMRTVAFCEIDPYCQRVLRKHWPDVDVFVDIRNLTANDIFDGVDLICGGFPCQDISVAGKGAGIEGERSGLWSEYRRLIGEVRPRYVIVENVAALLGRGIGRVLGDLAALGYDAEWHCIPASAVGAPHRRDRVWIVANSNSRDIRQQSIGELGSCDPPLARSDGSQKQMADAPEQRLEGRTRQRVPRSWGSSVKLAGRDWWLAEPDVGRVAHGISSRVDRLRALGNAIVPQIAEIIGRAIMDSF